MVCLHLLVSGQLHPRMTNESRHIAQIPPGIYFALKLAGLSAQKKIRYFPGWRVADELLRRILCHTRYLNPNKVNKTSVIGLVNRVNVAAGKCAHKL